MADVLRVCAHCGTLPHADTCPACAAPARLVDAAPDDDHGYWVRVEAALRCDRCKLMTPVDGVDVGERYRCAHCDLDQDVFVDSFADGLLEAHGVGDLTWPLPDGRHPDPDCPLPDDLPQKLAIHGPTAAFSWAEGGVRMTLRIGCPLCERCHAPLRAHTTGDKTVVRCASCDTREVYTLPAHHAGALAGALIAAYREGDADAPPPKPVTVVREGPKVVTLRCPQCGGGLDKPDRARVVCPYCKTVCAVEGPLRWLFAEKDAPSAPLWLRFKGPSPARVALEKTLKPALARARKKARKEAARAQPPPSNATARAKKPPPAATPVEGGKGAPLWVVPLIVVAVAAALMALGR